MLAQHFSTPTVHPPKPVQLNLFVDAPLLDAEVDARPLPLGPPRAPGLTYLQLQGLLLRPFPLWRESGHGEAQHAWS
jgi:hypothetical protein